jgi:uncharacterized short protein YbdD (DUF466 family)
MCDLHVVTVDTRGKSSSDIKGYHEHICSDAYFKRNIVGHPDAICFKSKVAELCGIHLKVYFHKEDGSAMHVENDIAAKSEINRAATLLTLDPETGFAEHHVRGVAYVVQNNGLAPLSLNQVWGIQELINYATDVYKSDPDHKKRGKRELMKSCKMYRYQSWGPLSIYKSRPEVSLTVAPPSVIKVKPSSRKPFQSIQA